jgi:hypothetical protein
MSLAKFEKLGLLLGVAGLILFLFLPLLLIDLYHLPASESRSHSSEESTVGIAVVARATTRRVLGATMMNFFRTTFASYSRAAGRTFIRRVIRFTVYTLLGALAVSTTARSRLEATPDEKVTHPLFVIALGVVGLVLSFYGVLWIAGPEIAMTITSGGMLSYPLAAVVAALPLAIYGVIHLLMARFFSLAWRINTTMDALLLQAYFTCSGVFVPMTTDIVYFGNLKQNMRAAMFSLLSLFAIHLTLGWIGIWIGSASVKFASNMFLLYSFVYAFPIPPLEGYDVWRQNRLVWLCIFLPILIAFLSLPESFTGLFGIVVPREIAS